MHIFTFFSLLGAAATVFLAIRLCAFPSENRPASLAFAGFLGCCALFVLDDAFYQENWFARWPWFYGVANPFIIAIGPCFFLYARGATEPGLQWRSSTALHFLPAALGFLLEIPTYLAPVETKLQQAAHDHDNAFTSAGVWFILLLELYGISYLSWAWWLLWKRRARRAEHEEEGRSHPLRGIQLFATLVLVVVVFSAVMDFTPWAQIGVAASVLATVLATFTILWTATQPAPLVAPLWPKATPRQEVEFDTFTAPNAARPAPSPMVQEPAQPVAEDTKASLEISATDAERIGARVRRLLEVERVYLDPELSLQMLADRAQTTRHKLSAVLRLVFQAKFYQVVAGYRVREAARVLQTKGGATRTIADVAFSSGFNTLSAFNAAFRAEFGVTPSVYRDQTQKKNSASDP